MSDPRAPALRCDLFCRVVDNLGDAGVCWRLARRLGAALGWQVQLLIDELPALARIAPGIDATAAEQYAGGVTVAHWTSAPIAGDSADVVIEAFACELPDDYLAAMARRTKKPVWINLEYLSAERWIDDCHGLASPHPRLPLTKHFYFPGFSSRSGGVLIEDDLESRRQAFLADPSRRNALLTELGADPHAPYTALVFCYPTTALPTLCAAWADSGMPVQCLIPGNLPAALAAFDASAGALTLKAIDFVAQERFDELLWCCDFAVVRGEDSFVRAQLAALPFAWHIYPQEGGVHFTKLTAYSDRYLSGLEPGPANAWREFNLAWNRADDMRAPWQALVPHLSRLRAHAQDWRNTLASHGDLALNLGHFVAGKLK